VDEVLAAVPRQLPVAIQAFVGRTHHLDELTRSLGRPGTRGSSLVVAIDGVAGVGKTSLAVQWSHQIKGRFPGGQLYTDLRGHDPDRAVTPERALEEFLRSLGVPAAMIPAGVRARAELYRSLLRGRRVLVVLDNAGTYEQVHPLVPDSPGCVAVVTSRRGMPDLVARGGTQPFSLGGLDPSEAIALLRQGIGAARVDAESGAAAEFARLCAYLPLALRVASRRAATRPGVSLAELAEELARERVRPGVPVADGEAFTGLRAALSWSYGHLPSDSADVFRLLGLHFGTHIGALAAAALTGTGRVEARRLLTVLTDAYLLDEVAPDRYQFHDLVRVFASERAAEIPEPERAAATRRLLTWYLHTADAAVHVLSPMGLRVLVDAPDVDAPGVAGESLGFDGQEAALAWYAAERDNLVAATRHASQCGQDAIAWQLPAVLWDFFSMYGHVDDWITTHTIGLDAAQRLGDNRGKAWMENNLGSAYRGLGQFDEALRHFHNALGHNEEMGNRQGEGWTRYNIGDTYRELGRFEEALTHLRQALLIGREVGERWSEGYTLNMIGDTYRCLGQLDEALRQLLPALVINREIGHRRGEGWTLTMIGDTYRERGQLDRAVSYYQQALAIRREIGDRRGEAATLASMGDACHQRREFDEARQHYQHSVAIRHEIGDRRGEALTLTGLGAVQQQIGGLDDARESLRRAIAIFEELGDPQADQARDQLNVLLGPELI